MKLELCKITDAPPEGTRIVPFFGRDVHVYRAGERIRAAANVCLHFGGPLEHDPTRLDHSDGRFWPKSGAKALARTPGTPMRAFA